MSRHTIANLIAEVTVVVGWDNPMMTFFAQVVREQDDDDPRDRMLLWLGVEPREITRPEDLIAPLAPYAVLTPAHVGQLRADRAASADVGPTPLQRRWLDWRRKPP